MMSTNLKVLEKSSFGLPLHILEEKSPNYSVVEQMRSSQMIWWVMLTYGIAILNQATLRTSMTAAAAWYQNSTKAYWTCQALLSLQQQRCSKSIKRLLRLTWFIDKRWTNTWLRLKWMKRFLWIVTKGYLKVIDNIAVAVISEYRVKHIKLNKQNHEYNT